jgi:hypothetical protein
MKIVQLVADWFYTNDGDSYEVYMPGVNDVTEILEHEPQGEGDRWFYDVYYGPDKFKRIFNPNSVSFETIKKGASHE